MTKHKNFKLDFIFLYILFMYCLLSDYFIQNVWFYLFYPGILFLQTFYRWKFQHF